MTNVIELATASLAFATSVVLLIAAARKARAEVQKSRKVRRRRKR